MKRIGIYGGTFDPIHHAHLILARDALEQLKLEHVVFIPAAMSPHKLDRTPTAADTRLEMLVAAIQDEAHFSVDEIELRRPPPSFAVETVETYANSEPAAELHYLIGSDNLPRLHTWHRFADLDRLVHFAILNRGATGLDSPYPIIERRIAISATQIRNRVASGQSIRYLVPPVVDEIIRRRRLYREPNTSPRKI